MWHPFLTWTSRSTSASPTPFIGRHGKRSKFTPNLRPDVDYSVEAQLDQVPELEPIAPIEYGSEIRIGAFAGAEVRSGLNAGLRTVTRFEAGATAESEVELGQASQSSIEASGDTQFGADGGGDGQIIVVAREDTTQSGPGKKDPLTTKEITAVLKKLH